MSSRAVDHNRTDVMISPEGKEITALKLLRTTIDIVGKGSALLIRLHTAKMKSVGRDAILSDILRKSTMPIVLWTTSIYVVRDHLIPVSFGIRKGRCIRVAIEH